ncbi:hypothetical protein CEUSTIGMA_g8910.t1 [Chlamydomonas eustigma]|uniref:2Fe-2S ferredoxin-type domain-containing protein n=1 Tax=Chlamydomonas eustigma TaxID=1157962 RepID=A0A250XEK8_9CHLO|nr:hypothetical protein CEUSTIGMA_g8910.t1 [Chlamydomonas eustigma]|eukprot:GAX81481.1 hypothetical protein CEUSTIGMA_g8910.t1 [Chlamydomonas eustigma]
MSIRTPLLRQKDVNCGKCYSGQFNTKICVKNLRCNQSVHNVQGRSIRNHSGSPKGNTQVSTLPVHLVFADSQNSTSAYPGEEMLEVALRSEETLRLGCCSGHCGVCEVEMTCYHGSSKEVSVIRTCIAKVPSGFTRIEIADMDDEVWG